MEKLVFTHKMFTHKVCLHLVAKLEEKVTNDTSRLSQGCNKLDIYKSMRLDRLHLTAPRELANVTVKLLSVLKGW